MQHYALDIAVLVQVRPAAVPSEYQFWYKLNIELIIYDVIEASKARLVLENEANFVRWKYFHLQKRNFHIKRIHNLRCEFSPSLSTFSVNISWKHCKVGTGILGRQTNTSKKSMEGNFVKCFSSPTEHALLETSQQLLSRFQTARTNIALFHNIYNLNIFCIGISASLGFKKPVGERLFRGYKELCAHTDRLADITHVIFVVHGVGQVVDDSSIIRNTNIMRDNVSQIMAKHFPKFQMETGQRAEFFPVEWRSSLRLDEGMVRHITPCRIMGLRNLLNSSGTSFSIP